MEDIYAFLDRHGISYKRFDHPAVFTCEEAEAKCPPMPGMHTKNLFLRNKKGDKHFLVSIGYQKKISIKALGEALDGEKLSFASPERLKKHLGLEPGSVSLLGVVNDPDHHVQVVIDQELWGADALGVHPLVNTATLVISHVGMVTFFGATGHEVRVIEVPEGSAK